MHSAQLEVIGSYGEGLLAWLERYTFPAEARHAAPEAARAGAALFLDALLAHGTTAALVFPTVHATSAEALFAAAQARGMRLITGKVLMDRNAPAELCDDVQQAERECRALIERWHGQGRLSYAVTVRFAPTSTPAQLAMAGRLCRDDVTLYAQTHLAETRQEVAWVRELFPAARSYLDVYADVGLLHARSVFAHGIWLDDRDLAALRDAGALLAHCPASNAFLGSGLFPWSSTARAGVAVSLASDVGGGTSLCLPQVMADAYKVQALRGERVTAWTLLHAATRAPAQALGLAGECGSLVEGCAADVCVWDWADGAVAERRLAVAQSLHERVFAWLLLATAANLRAARVEGVERVQRGK